MKIFNIDLNKYGIHLTAPFLRSGVLLAFVFAFVRPIIDINQYLLKARKQNLIKMNHNYQKFSVQKRLNDAFDQIERRIKIVSAVQYEGVYLYTEAEDDPYFSKTKWLHDDSNPIYLRTEAELYSEYDFIVEIPNTNINQIQLKAEIDFYILPSKRYLIKIV